jgi:hypothetical protein
LQQPILLPTHRGARTRLSSVYTSRAMEFRTLRQTSLFCEYHVFFFLIRTTLYYCKLYLSDSGQTVQVLRHSQLTTDLITLVSVKDRRSIKMIYVKLSRESSTIMWIHAICGLLLVPMLAHNLIRTRGEANVPLQLGLAT